MILKLVVWKRWILNLILISAQRVMCVKKYVENYESPWKYVFDFYLKKVGGKFLFQCNFDHGTLSITLWAWSSMTNYDSILILWRDNESYYLEQQVCFKWGEIYFSVGYNPGILKEARKDFLLHTRAIYSKMHTSAEWIKISSPETKSAENILLLAQN